MRVVGIPRPVFILLFVSLVLGLSSLLQSISERNLQFSSNPLFVFALFNIIIVAIIVGNDRPSSDEVDSIFSFLYSSYELEEDAGDDVEDTKSDKYCNMDGYESYDNDQVDDDDDESEDDDFDLDSDGYDEDDDDNGSDDEIGWGDMDEYDSSLEKRIEDFIDKVNKGWREERLRDSLSNPYAV